MEPLTEVGGGQLVAHHGQELGPQPLRLLQRRHVLYGHDHRLDFAVLRADGRAVNGGGMLGHWGGVKVYHLWSLASVNVRASCSGKMSPKPLWQQTGRGNQNGFRGGLCVVWGMGRNVLPAAPEAVAVAVHLQDVDRGG